MGVSFLNGAFLGGLSLVSIPIIIHLLQRRRFQVVKWGAMEFLRLSQRNRSRRLMIEQLLLLLIRCLIIAAVVLAVCRPIVRLGGMPIVRARGQVHAILILDNSYSMGYRPAGSGSETVFDRALKRAQDLVQRGLKQGDAVSIVLASDPPRALIRKPSLDLRSVSGMLRKGVTLSDSGTSYGKAARLALEIAADSHFVNREVFLIGDNQAAGWEGKASDPSAWEALGKMARVAVIPVREGPAPNTAVEWVQAARGLPTVHASTRIQARVLNRSPQPVRGATVSLEIDGKPEGVAQRVDLEPNAGSLVAFNQVFDRPGVKTCTVRLAEDRLPADDAGYLALRVRDNVRVLVVNGKPDPGAPQKDAAFFLQLALSPPITESGTEPQPLQVRTVGPTGLSAGALKDTDVVALSDVASLEEGARRALADFVQNGGGALFFLGGRVNPDLYNRDLYGAQPRLLPARIGPASTEKTSLDAGSLDHPALQRFRGAQDVDIGTAEFSRYYKLLTESGDKTVRVMARFNTGAPAMVEKQFGLGKVVVVPSTATTEWNTLPLKPFFLPLTHQLVAYLATGTEGTRNAQVGDPLVKPLPLAEASRPITLTDPKGDPSTLKAAVSERGALVTLDHATRAGFYRLSVPGGTEDVFAVNRDAAESDLRALDRAQVAKQLPVKNWTWIGLNEDLVSALERSRQGVELWRHMLFAALALMALETMLAQLFGRRS